MLTRSLAALLLGTVLGAFSLAAQTSSVQGTVTDGSSAAIPEAVVTVTNQSTSAVRKTLSSATGDYSFLQLPPGAYKVAVEKPGFRAANTELRLQIDTPANLNIQLELGQVTESVSVEAEALAINTQNASVGNPFTENQIKGLPLQTRNVVDLLACSPAWPPPARYSAPRPTRTT